MYEEKFKSFICHAKIADDPVDSGDRLIEGYASTGDTDRDLEIVEPTAFEKTIKTFMKNPIVVFNHYWNEGIGTVEELSIDKKGLKVKIRIAKGTELADKVWTLIEQKVYRAFSFAFRVLEFQDTRKDPNVPADSVIKDLDLLEVSVVTIPANGNATFSLAKGLMFGNDFFNPEIAQTLEKISKQVDDLSKKIAVHEPAVEVGITPDIPNQEVLENHETPILLTEKSGRTLSAANEAKLRKAVEHMNGAVSAITELLAAVDESDDGKGEQPQVEDDAVLLAELQKINDKLESLMK